MRHQPDRSVVVTGAVRGIGLGIARTLSDAGWVVVGVDHTAPDRAGELWDAPDSGNILIVGDTRDRGVHREAVRAAQDRAPLTGWVNNAGITRTTPLHQLADAEQADAAEQTIREVIDINGLGYLWGCSAAVDAFLNQDRLNPERKPGGAIVNIGSIHGRAAWTDHAAYEFTKGGIDALTRSVAVTYGGRGIRANTVAPGRIRTEAIEVSIAAAADPGEMTRTLDSGPPMQRMGSPAEIGAVVAFLLSDQASYLSGQSIAVDGGWTAQFGQPG